MTVTPQIELQFGKWLKYFRPFIESPEMDKLFGYIKQRAATEKILPDSSNVFRCFRDTNPGELKAIVAGICPYHSVSKSGLAIADGLALSCSLTDRMQPSLEKWYDAIEHEYTDGHGLDIDMMHNPDLSYLARQGVLLYNVALTVEKDKALSMNTAWEPFNKFFWEEVICKYFRGIPIILLGQQAWNSEKHIAPMLHYVYKLSHPASAAYANGEWSSEGTFKKVNEVLQQNNGCWIEWAQHKSTEIRRKELAAEKKSYTTDDDLPF